MINYSPLKSKSDTNLASGIKIGKVTAVDQNTHTYTIQTEGSGFVEGKPATAPGGGYFRGSGDGSLIQEGAQVLYVHSGATGYIVGCLPEPGIPSTHTSPVSYTNVSSIKEAQKDTNYISYRGGNPPDLLPGDFAKYTPEGGFLSLLRGPVAKIGANPLAQMMFNNIDDLGRIVARNFDIFTDFGEVRFSNDEGETNFELYGSPVFHETLGADNIGEELGTHAPDGERNRYRVDPYDKMGKWRCHLFGGWLGDAFHLFISRRGDPNKRTDSTTQDGVTEVMLANDGAVRVRSCRELMLEKVPKIRVPKKIREFFHNEKGNSREDGYAPSPHETFEWSEEDKEGRRAQLPEYHSHVVDHEEIRHFKDHDKDWNVTSEVDANIPSQAQDIWEGQEEAEFEETYSVIHQRSDGSVYIEDTHGSCIDMSQEHISISAKKDIRLQAGRDVLVSSGRDLTARALSELELVSHSGSIRAKAHEDLFLAGERNASLDAATGNVTILSRTGHAQIRAERGDVLLKADLGKIDILAVSGELDIRASGNVDILSDGAVVNIHGSSEVQITSVGKVLVATGIESPSAEMTAEQRDISGKTNTTLSIDRNNTVQLTELPENSYLELAGPTAYLHAKSLLQITSDDRVSSFTEGAKLNLDANSYELSTEGTGVVRRNGNNVIQQTDSDGDVIWQPGSSHSPENRVESSANLVTSVKADVKASELAGARFRYREGDKNEDIRIYEYPWQKLDLENNPSDTSPLKELIDTDLQDTPDLGASREVTGENQGFTTNEGEQMPPFSQYKKYNGGTYSFESGVEVGVFEDTDEYFTPTTYTEIPENTGRVSSIPDSAKGESFKGTLEEADTEDVINKLC